jgi:hypothetical protein
MLLGYAVLETPVPLVILASLTAVNTLVHLWHFLNHGDSCSLEVTATCILMFQRIVSLAFNLKDRRSEGFLSNDGEK